MSSSSSSSANNTYNNSTASTASTSNTTTNQPQSTTSTQASSEGGSKTVAEINEWLRTPVLGVVLGTPGYPEPWAIRGLMLMGRCEGWGWDEHAGEGV